MKATILVYYTMQPIILAAPIGNKCPKLALKLRKNVRTLDFFWSIFSRIATEYEVLQSTSVHSVQVRQNKHQKKLCIWLRFTESNIGVCSKSR